jgi:GDP-L-fucose synthase
VREDALLTGPLEPANQWYAIAKIASIKLAQAYRRQYGCDFISATPANLYGPGDNFDLATGHVLPSLIRKTHEAMLAGMPTMQIWGSGRARREFLHVDDCADALIFLMQGYSGESQVNIGTGADISILELAQLVANIVGFKGSIVTDPSMPDGTPARLLSSDLMHGLGWNCSIPLEAGIAATYRWYLDNAGTARGLHRHQE